ncbi:MAG: Fe-S cluster assembly ATPase SufC [Candidatus Shikimatogenerans bostrichidophilus]|nr:MAG: Fe-S cluster assembly ATPase SufC [Candidatus Shikimatogenerans bostrichidophilus]
MLKIKNLYSSINNTLIIKNLNLKIKNGEIHILMGPNGSGKSTLSYIITGKPKYKINKGEIIFCKKKINELSPDKISKLGIFLSFQNPIEIDGITMFNFLKILKKKNNFKKLYKLCKILNIDKKDLYRFFNLGFSGGEKKKNEILQMLILKPKFIILDEIDSGLDIDTIKYLFKIIKIYLKNNPKCSLLIITHNTSIIKYIIPNKVHIIYNGSIILSGNSELIYKIEKIGYNGLIKKKYNDKK